MNVKKSSYLILIGFVFLSLIGWTVYGQKQSQPKAMWEYRVVSETDKISLNELGAQGWELVTVEMGGAQEVYYFKRTK